MKVQSDILRTEKRRSVQAVHSIRESPLSEHAAKSAGSYPLPYGKSGRFQRQIGWQHGVFSSHVQRGEKAFYFTKTYDIKGDTKCLI